MKNLLTFLVAVAVILVLGKIAQSAFCSAVDKYESAVADTFGQCRDYDVVTDGTVFTIRQGVYVSSLSFDTAWEAAAEAIKRKVSCEEDKAHEKKQWREVE